MKEDIKLTANSDQLCKCEQSNLNITEVNEGNILLEKFCPACGATTIIYKEMPKEQSLNIVLMELRILCILIMRVKTLAAQLKENPT